MYVQEISASKFVDLCLGVTVSEKSSYFTHSPYFLKTSLTILFFTRLAVHMRHFNTVVVTNREWTTFFLMLF